MALQWLAWFGAPLVFSGITAGYVSVLGGFLGGLMVFLWWVFFSRAPRIERWGGALLMIVAMAATPYILHKSIATGMMGMMFPIYAVPVLSLAFVLWAVVSRYLSGALRPIAMVAAVLVACGGFGLLRIDGIAGDGAPDFEWRWTATAEEQLLARAGDQPAPSLADPPEMEAAPEWPGFRGPGRDGVVSGLRIATDWSSAPPVEVWRRPVGPGWSSFAVAGDLIYTQEQRGEQEVIACYDAAAGEPVWLHGDPTRFWEANAGAGPRATPTLSGGRVYALGATGILNALDARDGSVIWSRNAADDTGVEIPPWGLASSPLVMDDLVIAATAGKLAAYDRATGEPRWMGPDGGWGYSSPHSLTFDGVPQVVLLNGAGAVSVAPSDGTVLWEHDWRSDGIVQPALSEDGDLLIGAGSGIGTEVGLRRVAVVHQSGQWTTEERWTSIRLKPYFNDFVVHDGNAYGFDGGILACVELGEGKRQWKGGRYGHGQVVLLPEQDLLLVLTEGGEVALVSATPDRFSEVARIPAIEGKTWNHPAVANDLLLVRNSEEMAAFRLPLEAGRTVGNQRVSR
ncbi:MAG TPA: PQQ-binding-like beta-propeller repeat protein [Alphaproteobacteria bacterium]|nr:PQQ-binding-like beta-propeller repeat protein [Alphaproteobacteria bacterium]